MFISRSLRSVAKLSGVLALLLAPAFLQADTFNQTNLVSGTPGVAAVTDPNIGGAWGFSYSATSPFWISDQTTGLSTLYDGAGNRTALEVNIPGGGGATAGPTGQVFNSSTGFVLTNGTKASFIFDTLQGTIAGWNGAAGTTAITEVTTAGASYTGLALANNGASYYLYAADSATGAIRVFNSSFQPVTLAGNFTDPNLPAGFVPFNVQTIGTQLYVEYAKLDSSGNDLAGGYVDIFNTDGTFVSRFSSSSALYAPWGITLAPSSFGSFGGDILVGNNGNGEINAFDPTTGAFVGTLDGPGGTPISNNDLWALGFRTGGANISTNALYFAAGFNDNGLFGAITPTPEPGTFVMGGLGVLSLAMIALRRRKAW